MRSAFLLIATLAGIGCQRADAESTPAAAAPSVAANQPGAPAAQGEADPRVARADLARISGKPDAKVWILVVSDFQCPYCKEYHDKTAKQLHKEFVEPGIARIAYINYPLRIHPNAMPAAEAAMCAGAQDKFWPFHDQLFATVDRWGPVNDPALALLGIAIDLKLDVEAYKQCMSDDVMLPMIQADYQRGTQAGATSTPTFLIGKVMIPGNAPIDVFRTAIKETLAGTM
jgi:protein-disulfide isomerase